MALSVTRGEYASRVDLPLSGQVSACGVASIPRPVLSAQILLLILMARFDDPVDAYHSFPRGAVH